MLSCLSTGLTLGVPHMVATPVPFAPFQGPLNWSFFRFSTAIDYVFRLCGNSTSDDDFTSISLSSGTITDTYSNSRSISNRGSTIHSRPLLISAACFECTIDRVLQCANPKYKFKHGVSDSQTTSLIRTMVGVWFALLQVWLLLSGIVWNHCSVSFAVNFVMVIDLDCIFLVELETIIIEFEDS